MKKVFLTLFLCVLACTSAFARKAVKVVSGSNVFRTEATATFVLDFSNTMWDDSQTFAEYAGEDYDKHIASANKGFHDGITTNCSKFKFQLVDDPASADYSITYKITYINQRWGFACNPGQMIGHNSGTVEVKDNRTGEIVCVINVDEQEGQPDFVANDRIYKSFEVLGWEISKLR